MSEAQALLEVTPPAPGAERGARDLARSREEAAWLSDAVARYVLPALVRQGRGHAPMDADGHELRRQLAFFRGLLARLDQGAGSTGVDSE